MNGFSVSSRLTLSDWKAYQAASTRRTQTRGWRGAALMFGPLAVTAIVVYALMRLRPSAAEANWLLAGLLLGCGSLIVVGRIVRLWMRPLQDAAFLGECTLDFSPLGIRTRRPQVDAMISWGAVREITSTADHLFVWIDAIAAYVVPVRDLPRGMSREDAQSILHDLRAQVSSLPALGAVTPAEASYVPERSPHLPRSVTRSMQALVRWLTWRPFDARALDAPDFAIAVLALLSVVLVIGLGRIGVGPNAEFNFFSAQVLGCKTLGLLAIGWIIWRASDPQVSWRAVLFILASLTLLAVPVRWGIDHLDYGTTHIVASWGFLVFLFVYLDRALKVATGHRQLRALALSLIVLVIGGGLIARYLEAGPIWYTPENEELNTYTRSQHEAERLLMGQPARIDATVAAMAPRSGDTSMYMVGFAGVGEQKVFAGEISLAAKVIGERYGTRERTLLLVNDQRDLESRPLASVTGLKLALADIGRRMDRERDVLILVISSHGSKAPAISVSNGGIPLNDLTGKELKAALDDAGIRWRVVIISACHARAFIPYLSDERTIVIAAAAADRTSFGCSNDRDLTNFGEAFIRDALPTAPSIRAAFEKARESIAARERAEKLTPSIPTAYFGTAMEEKLAAER
jgi:Peptidase C13 family